MKSLDTVKKDFSDVVLVPTLREQMREIAASTANTKLHGAAYRHMLFYGPPGACLPSRYGQVVPAVL